MKSFFRTLSLIIGILSLMIFSLIYYSESKIDDKYYIESYENLLMPVNLPIDYKILNDESKVSKTTISSKKQDAVLNLFGVFPIKTVGIIFQEREEVQLLGTPFGIKLYTDGVLIVDIVSIETSEGKASPAEIAGLKKGDYITKINDIKITSNKEIENIISNNNGEDLLISYCRNSIDYQTILTPSLSIDDGEFHVGIWVRDSSAGIGTLTFYNPEENIIAALGHGLCDSDTGKLISVNEGALVDAEILSIKKAKNNNIGELCGWFINNYISTSLTNSHLGIYAYPFKDITTDILIQTAFKQETERGQAQILSTINGTTPKFYDCEIIKINSYNNETKNFIIEITDEELLSKTGGIVQGMSGSPILQNGKLIGAVTHVLVDDPTKGYAIFAENMLETAKSVAESNKLKDAS